MDWSVAGLRRLGFEGFVSFPEVAARVDDGPGVYVIVRTSAADPTFTATTVGGSLRGRDSSYPLATVEANWISGEAVLYIGKADVRKSTRDGLAKRLDEYRRFGLGQKVLHGGGRLVWQLADHENLLVAWRGTPRDKPAERLEDELLLDFMEDHGGRMPFANVRLPSRAARAARGLLQL